MKRFILPLLTVFSVVIPSFAWAQNDPVDGRHTVVELYSETAIIAPGVPFTVALSMTPEPGWHTYWINPGDAGIATTINWTLPEGFKADPIQFPTPETIPFSGLVNYGYSHENALLVTITPPITLAEGPIDLVANAVWLVCDDEICVPEEDQLSLTLRAGSGETDAASTPYFNAARAALPAMVDWNAHYSQSLETFSLFVPMPLQVEDVSMAHFFPINEGLIDYASPQILKSVEGGFVLSTSGSGILVSGVQKGVLVLQSSLDNPKEAFEITARPGSISGDSGYGQWGLLSEITLPMALLFALAGGIILNLMPCVFPVLSLKALSLAKTGGDERASRENGLYYTLGILASFAVIGGALLIIRNAGAAVGWGFQLQSPMVVGLLALLMFAIALNLFGFFEIGGRLAGTGNDWVSRLSGKSGAFATGALATLVATPCTAPFMGSALGFALTQSAVVSMLVFLSLGFGLALPFLLIAFVPVLRRKLPRPGAWMLTFKQFLGFPMVLTALWLAWVMGRQAGLDGMAIVLVGFVLTGFAVWAIHQGAARSLSRKIWRTLGALALLVALGGVIDVEVVEITGAKAEPELAGEAFDQARLESYIAANEPVFVYFTADWCVSCKWNEHTTLKTEAVSKAFEKAGVKVMVGDWTNRDPAITEALKNFGRVGVPLYIYYRPGIPTPEILGQILTVGTLTELVSDRI